MLYLSGMEAWSEWTSVAHDWLLVGATYVDDSTYTSVADIAADELSIGGYARLPVANTLRAPSESGGYFGMAYGADHPHWDALAAGTVVSYLVLAEHRVADATAALIARWQLDPTTTDGGSLGLTMPPWVDPYGTPFPSGNASTGLVHLHWNAQNV